MNEDKLIAIFCLVDDFCKEFEVDWTTRRLENLSPNSDRRRKRSSRLSLSEVMTIAICFHSSGYRTFKNYYMCQVESCFGKYFPNLLSYSRFVELMQRVMFPLFAFLQRCLGKNTGVSFVDSAVLSVCHQKRILSHRVFKGLATRSKSSMGWFFGFKLHLIVNHMGEIVSFQLTPGNADDRQPVLYLAKKLTGKLFGDRGYISKALSESLLERGVELITRVKKNMKNKLIPLTDKLCLRKRGLIESVHNKLKNICQIEHHRHRSPRNFLVNFFGALTAYSLDPRKPTLLHQRKRCLTMD